MNGLIYFNSSKYSDLKIRCEGQEFNAHKIVLCGQSKYFSAMCDGDWKEGVDGVIELKEDDASVVKAMLHFLYRFDYDGSGNDQGRVSPMFFNSRVYSIADKYDVPALRLLAKEKFEEAVGTCWNMDDFVHVIPEVYDSTPPTDRGLRDIVVKVTHEHIKTLLEKKEFQYAIEETVGFAADIIRLMAGGGNLVRRKYECPNCNNF
ncbi:hypothetical protein FGG08_003812 [Glutinoglossum americanum]|uniref:BTB domain-containing protein n=1 Tax=Glutinoglossum americanum TaxID=1670608 RepID=A0A9P8L339_9PEZI|nr:hypothetical protein FGG08_003812 [Glutinoglossum americanum]